MTSERLADGLLNAGLTPDDVEQLRPLVGSIATALRGFAGGDFTHAWWIPGRLEVFGKHTDYAGGRSLVGAVPRGFVLTARGRQDRTVRLLDAGRGQDLLLRRHRRERGRRELTWLRHLRRTEYLLTLPVSPAHASGTRRKGEQLPFAWPGVTAQRVDQDVGVKVQPRRPSRRPSTRCRQGSRSSP